MCYPGIAAISLESTEPFPVSLHQKKRCRGQHRWKNTVRHTKRKIVLIRRWFVDVNKKDISASREKNENQMALIPENSIHLRHAQVRVIYPDWWEKIISTTCIEWQHLQWDKINVIVSDACTSEWIYWLIAIKDECNYLSVSIDWSSVNPKQRLWLSFIDITSPGWFVSANVDGYDNRSSTTEKEKFASNISYQTICSDIGMRKQLPVVTKWNVCL